MAEELITTPTASNFPRRSRVWPAIRDAGKQHYRVERRDYHAPHESFLLGNNREYEIVMRPNRGK